MVQFNKAMRRLMLLWVPVLLGTVTVVSLAIQLANPISSTDLWWHMLLGRQILETGSLIADHSQFTWTPALSYFPYTGWLGEVVLYLIYEYAGSTGLMALRYATFFLIILLAWRYALTRGIASNPLTWTVILIALTLTWQAPLIKTELFTIGFFTFAVWLYFHMRYRGDQAWRLPYLLPLLLVIWVNTHGAFIIAALFFAAAAIGEVLNNKFCPSQAMPPRLQKHFFIALALCLPAIFISPFGYDLPYSIVSKFLTYDNSFSRISGFIPTYRFNVAPYYMLEYMILAMFIFVVLLWQKLKNRKTDWVIVLAFLIYSAIFTQLARVTFFLGPVFLFACLDLLAEREGSWAWPQSKVLKTITITLCISIAVVVGWRTVSNNICKLSSYKGGIKHAFGVSTSFPITETEYIKKNLPGRKIGNMYRDGGYLEYHLWPEKLAMIDTRFFPFSEWINDYFDFVDGIDIEKFVKGHPADFWLVNYQFGNPFLWFSQSNEWKLAFLGPTAGVFVPAESAPERPEIVPDIGSNIHLGGYSFAFRTAMRLNDLTFANRLYLAAQDVKGVACDEHIILTHEMGDTITGFQAYNEGRYQEAYRILKKKNRYLYTQDRAADALVKLAEQAWNRGDIHGAREWYVKIFLMLPRITITDLYNLAIIDWHYRFKNIKDFKTPADNLHWQRLVTYILMQEGEITPSQRFILETAKAMKQGRYQDTARLVPRSRNFDNDKATTK